MINPGLLAPSHRQASRQLRVALPRLSQGKAFPFPLLVENLPWSERISTAGGGRRKGEGGGGKETRVGQGEDKWSRGVQVLRPLLNSLAGSWQYFGGGGQGEKETRGSTFPFLALHSKYSQ